MPVENISVPVEGTCADFARFSTSVSTKVVTILVKVTFHYQGGRVITSPSQTISIRKP